MPWQEFANIPIVVKKFMGDSKKVLITGGAGFIGQSLVKKFEKAMYDFSVFDLVTPTLTHGKYIEGDVFDSEKLTDAVKKHDVIVHLVGLADTRAAQKEPAKSFELNVVSLKNLLEACRISGKKKIIFPSSAAVYGVTRVLPIKEDYALHPSNVYSWHKYMCEKMILCYHDNFGLEYVILRLFNVYGKGSKGAMEIFLKKAARGETIETYGLRQYRDFVYAGDVAEAFYKSVICKKANNKIINIGSGKGTQIKEILGLVREIYPETKWVNKRLKFATYDSIADITLAKKLLDYKPRTSRKFMKKIIMEELVECKG